jgi:hypothetical protein
MNRMDGALDISQIRYYKPNACFSMQTGRLAPLDKIKACKDGQRVLFGRSSP